MLSYSSLVLVILERQFSWEVRVPCKSKLSSCEEDSDNGTLITQTLQQYSDNGTLITQTLQQYSDERDMYYPLHSCSTLLTKQCEIMEGYHFA